MLVVGRPEARALLESEVRRGEPLLASVLTKVEVLAGMRRGEGPRTRALPRGLIWVEVTDAIAERAGRSHGVSSARHPGVDTVDYLIAATREELDVPLWTLNVRHFPMVRGLSPPY